MKNKVRQDIEERLASASDRRDEAPNIALAEELCRDRNPVVIEFVTDILDTGNRGKQADAIKILYEIGARDPHLIAPHTACFLRHMQSKNNRIVWGALMALAAIARIEPNVIGANLSAILTAADNGSVIAKDQAIQILIALRLESGLKQMATEQLFDRLKSAAVNQLPMYSEQVSATLGPPDYKRFLGILSRRITEDMRLSKRKRIQKVITKVQLMADQGSN